MSGISIAEFGQRRIVLPERIRLVRIRAGHRQVKVITLSDKLVHETVEICSHVVLQRRHGPRVVDYP